MMSARAAIACLVAAFAVAAIASTPMVPGIGNTIEIDPSIKGKLFYWLFPAQSAPASGKTPFILWMTGGPGCSGSLAALFENGPYAVTEHLNLVPNPYSWNLNANVMYIDQPYGVGFSSVESSNDYLHNQTQVADDVLTLLLQFFEGPGAAYAGAPFYVSCESYGGHYCPSVSARIIKAASPLINFQGMSIGNGMTDPIKQMPAYGAYAAKYNLVDKAVLDKVAIATAECEKLLAAQDYLKGYEVCLPIINDILSASGINPYNRDLKCPPQFPLCYNLTAQTDYMNLPYVQQHLGVNKVWQTCNDAVNADFTYDWVEDYANDVVTVLEAGFPAFIYYGQLDFICNYMGGVDYLSSGLTGWSGQAAFNAAPTQPWMVNGQQVGSVQSANGLSLILVAEAGHMVPYDQPALALEIISNLMFSPTGPWNTTSTL
eukprot:Amastigsp_a13_2441.p2 type:complete len:431 gc:universal Amastigsp_a13_2441:24-1316(+)